MDTEKFIKLVKERIRGFYWSQEGRNVEEKDIYIVWLSKTLQNSKAMASTTIHDHRYFEITFNGDKSEMYVDAYKKEYNKAFKVPEAEVVLDGEG